MRTNIKLEIKNIIMDMLSNAGIFEYAFKLGARIAMEVQKDD